MLGDGCSRHISRCSAPPSTCNDADMLSNRSFDALALTQQYDHSSSYSTVHDIASTAFRQLSYGQRVQSHRPKLPRQWNSSLHYDGCALGWLHNSAT